MMRIANDISPTIVFIGNHIHENSIHYLNTNGFDLVTAQQISELTLIAPTIIILEAATWELYFEHIKASELYENVPVFLLSEETNLSKIKEKIAQGFFCCVQNLQSTMTLMLLHSAVKQFEKNSENTIKNNELNRLLSTNYLMLDAKNQFLEQAKKHIQTFIVDDMKISKKSLQKLHTNIEKHLKEEYQYQLFKVHFEEVHPQFYKKLLAINENLSDNNLKLVSFIKMGFNNAEISFFLNISISAVKKAIQRMKQKLKIPPEDSLRKFIFNI